ncbi:MAG: TRAP transporter substrate-binding protein DctP [Mailhella sp.]|nr:TRAP transporter substrate-binding protein DctP [Mailhella sp.]
MLKNILASAAASAFLLCAGYAHAETFDMNFQAPYNPTQTQYSEILAPWAEAFAKDTNGSLAVTIAPNGSIVDIQQAADAVKNGMIDIISHGPALFPEDYKQGYMVTMPFLINSSQHGTAFIYNLYEKNTDFKENVDRCGKMLAMWSPAIFAISSVNVPIKTPADLKGRRVLIISPNDSALIEAWGGVPVLVTPGDIYVGLQRGMGECFFTAISFQKGMRVQEVVKYITPLPSSSSFMVLSMHDRLFDAMDADQKAYVEKVSGRAFSEKIAASLDNDVVSCLKIFEDAGAKVVNLTPEEYQQFKEPALKLIDTWWVDNLKSIGLTGDIKAQIEAYYKLAAETPDPNAK